VSLERVPSSSSTTTNELFSSRSCLILPNTFETSLPLCHVDVRVSWHSECVIWVRTSEKNLLMSEWALISTS
jgi:hypothetical protein